jgi:nicotinamide-nucleotide amidase
MNFLASNLVKKLIKKKITLSFAESCTGGLLSSTITAINNSSKIFKLGIVVYSNKSKINLLKVPKHILNSCGAVSEQVCYCLVENLNKLTKTKISVSITGIAGPNGGSLNKPVGLVYIGIKKGNTIKVRKFKFKNKGRLYIQKSTVKKTLELILNLIK